MHGGGRATIEIPPLLRCFFALLDRFFHAHSAMGSDRGERREKRLWAVRGSETTTGYIRLRPTVSLNHDGTDGTDLGSRLDRQWFPWLTNHHIGDDLRYRLFIYPPPQPHPRPTKITFTHNTMLNLISVSFCTACIIVILGLGLGFVFETGNLNHI